MSVGVASIVGSGVTDRVAVAVGTSVAVGVAVPVGVSVAVAVGGDIVARSRQIPARYASVVAVHAGPDVPQHASCVRNTGGSGQSVTVAVAVAPIVGVAVTSRVASASAVRVA
jgi:hypothetical protein